MIDLDAIKARCDAATPGVISLALLCPLYKIEVLTDPKGLGVNQHESIPASIADFELLNNSHKDTPALLAEVERLEKERIRLEREGFDLSEKIVRLQGEVDENEKRISKLTEKQIDQISPYCDHIKIAHELLSADPPNLTEARRYLADALKRIDDGQDPRDLQGDEWQ